METATTNQTGLPDGYAAIPIHPPHPDSPLRVCVLVRQLPDPVAGHLVLLLDWYDARTYLGCVTDAAGRVQSWLELWVQNLDGLEASLPAYQEAFSNFSLDARWAAQAEAFRKMNPEAFLSTGWEGVHPPPVFLDLSRFAPVSPASGEKGQAWELCRNDQALQTAKLPAYSTSLFRYLSQPGGSAFVAVTAGAPENTNTRPLSEALAGTEHHLAFNPQGGLMMVSKLSPIAFEEYLELLAGKPWPGIEHGKKRIQLDGAYATLADLEQLPPGTAHLFLGLHGREGRFLEGLHLRLQLLVDAFRETRAFVQHEQLPFLNLTAESFRVSLKPVGSGLPLLWTARTALVRPGAAFALPVETSDLRYFIRARASAASIFLPEGLSAALQGSGSVRIRKVLAPDQGRTVLEGTLVAPERPSVSPHDLLWIRLPLPSGRLDLYGHLYTAESLAQGEIRFRTVPQKFSEAALAALKAAEGVSFARSPFEIVPLLSTPCDLYALGVLAVRTLLVDGETTLAVALDEVLSLARQAGAEHNPEVSLGARLREICQRDQRYAASLGPHRLRVEGMSPEEAGRLMPSELWYDLLAWVVSLFPGLGPDSVCRDYGDVPALALETAFNRPLEELEKLLVHSRSLIVIDWTFNEEINDVIRNFLDKTSAV